MFHLTATRSRPTWPSCSPPWQNVSPGDPSRRVRRIIDRPVIIFLETALSGAQIHRRADTSSEGRASGSHGEGWPRIARRTWTSVVNTK